MHHQVHHPISDICYRLRRKIEMRFVTLQKKKLQEMKNIKFCQIMKQAVAGTEEALLILTRKELDFFVPLYFRNFLKLVLNNFIHRSHNYSTDFIKSLNVRSLILQLSRVSILKIQVNHSSTYIQCQSQRPFSGKEKIGSENYQLSFP